jgi:thiamine biosynthesis lipoprotein
MSSSPPFYRFAHEAMGTTFEVLVADSEKEYAGQASQAIFLQVDRIEALFSRFNLASEISQINRLRPGQSLKIGIETYECLVSAQQIHKETGGAFDVNFRAERRRPSSEKQIREHEKNEAAGKAFEVACTGEGFVLTASGDTGGQGHPVLDLDLGGIGKGYALDCAGGIISDWGLSSVLVHGGTSTAFAVGPAPGLGPEERGWPVGAGWTGTASGSARRVFLWNRALSGSGTEVKGRHILDPGTGRPADVHRAAWVSHPEAAIADALSTAFMVMTTAAVRHFCSRHPEVWALIIEPGGSTVDFNRDILLSS